MLYFIVDAVIMTLMDQSSHYSRHFAEKCKNSR